MKTSLKFAAIAAAALSIGLLAGCGGDQKAASSKAASAAADGKTSVKLVLSSTERPLSWADEMASCRAMNMIFGRKSIKT